jgi:hypothetical protein
MVARFVRTFLSFAQEAFPEEKESRICDEDGSRPGEGGRNPGLSQKPAGGIRDPAPHIAGRVSGVDPGPDPDPLPAGDPGPGDERERRHGRLARGLLEGDRIAEIGDDLPLPGLDDPAPPGGDKGLCRGLPGVESLEDLVVGEVLREFRGGAQHCQVAVLHEMGGARGGGLPLPRQEPVELGGPDADFFPHALHPANKRRNVGQKGMVEKGFPEAFPF